MNLSYIYNQKLWSVQNFKILNVLVCVSVMALFINRLNFDEVADYIRVIGSYSLFIILCSAVSYFIATIAWRTCINTHEYLPISQAWLYRQAGETISTLNPANIIAGEGAKVLFLSRHKISKSQALLSILISRFLMIITVLIIFATVGSSVINGNILQQGWSIYFQYLTVILLVISVVVFFLRESRHIRTNSLQRPWIRNTTRFTRYIIIKLTRFYRLHKIKLITAFLITLLHWLIGALEVGIILHAFDINLSLLDMFLVDSGVMVLKSFGAIIPAQIGAEEIANLVMLNSIGLHSEEIWAAFSVIRRLRQLFWLLIGLLIIIILFKKSPV